MKAHVYQKLTEHVDKIWPNNRREVFTWELGKIQSALPRFSVVRVEPRTKSEPWIYLTEGAWEVDVGRDYRMEFFIMCPFENPRHVETLAMLASFHSDPNHHLDQGGSVNIGRGWIDGSEYNHLLVSRPYPFGPALEVCRISENLVVRYLWLLPISGVEDQYRREFGLEALEQKFDDAGIDFLNPNRPSAVS